jgi:hypothetical protein
VITADFQSFDFVFSTDAERAAMVEEDEELAAHVPLSSRKWYRDSLATADLCLVEAASLADPNASRGKS